MPDGIVKNTSESTPNISAFKSRYDLHKLSRLQARNNSNYVPRFKTWATFSFPLSVLALKHCTISRILGVTVASVVGIYAGGVMSIHIAALLEENEIFTPQDDEDDD
ncbi:unnamed protein product, partial [Meganyctiphanes norvegica]